MEALVSKIELQGAELVKAVSSLHPGSNIASVLDRTNWILAQRLLNTLKMKKYDTVFHLLEDVGELNYQALDMITRDDGFPPHLQDELRALLNAHLVRPFLDYLPKNKGSFMARLCSSKR
jgi:hypothetical protein